MPDKDTNEKLLTDIDEIFADIYNCLCFDGKKVLTPNKLSEAPLTNAYIYTDKTKGLISDVSKYYKDSNLTIALLNIENQSYSDPDMPLRMIDYEGAKYNSQLIANNKQRFAVVSLVLNFNTKHRWNTSKTLKECINDYPRELDAYINDYKINVIDVAFLDKEEIDKFSSDFKVLADYFYQIRKNKVYEVPSDTNYLKYPAQLVQTLSAITGDSDFKNAYNEYVEKNKEGGPIKMTRIMDTYLPYIKAKAEGREEGKTIGIEEGMFKSLTKSLKTLMSKNYTFDESCDLLDVDDKTKEKLLNTGEFSLSSFKKTNI